MGRINSAGEALNVLLRRCVECPPITPSCPTCAQGETCSLIPASCNSCASTKCVKLGTLPGQAAPKKSTPVGAIVGGVIAGVAGIIIIVFLLWFFCIRPRRRRRAQMVTEKRDQSALSRTGSRAHSIASTVLTRASNVIQIAYIPGVTGRSPPASPGIPPPMPSVAHRLTATSNNSSPQVEQHFFMPNDLRDSTWSDASSIDPRMSMGPSFARASVNTTIYRNDAVVPPRPAMQGFRAQANMVSVKNGSSPSPSAESPSTPPVPQVPKGINGSSIVARNVTARPIEVKKTGSGPKVPTLANLAQARSAKSAEGSASSTPNTFSDEKEVLFSPATIIVDSPTTPTMQSKQSHGSLETASTSRVSAVLPKEGPLAGKAAATQRPDSGGLTALIEDAIKNASSPRPEARRQDSGPFSDANEVKE